MKEMRLRGIGDIGAGNAYLPEFMADFNRRFAVAPRTPEDAHRAVLHDAAELDLILCEHHARKLTKNLTIGFRSREYQVTGRGNGYRLRGDDVRPHGAGRTAHAHGRARHDDVGVRRARAAQAPHGPRRRRRRVGLEPARDGGRAGRPQLRRRRHVVGDGVRGDLRVRRLRPAHDGDRHDPHEATDAATLRRGFDHDAHGRLDTATHPAAGTTAGLSSGYEYNARGYPWKITAGTATLASYTAMDAWRNVGSATYGNGVRTTRAHDEKTGRVKDIDTGRGTATLQDESYDWRSDGLLRTRERGTDAEAFVHDGLGRLKSATAAYAGDDGSTATRTPTYGYDDLGNVTSRTGGPTSYAYGDAARPTRLTGVTLDGVATTLAYEENAGGDATGHVEKYDAATGDDTFVSWNGRGLPAAVTLGATAATATPTARDEFRYGPDGERYYRKTTWTEETTDDAGATTTRTRTAHAYRIGGYERIVGDAHAEYATVEKTRAGAALQVRRTARTGPSPAPAFEYVHADHLGSTAAVSDASGAALPELAHDPYGTRREADWSGALAGEDVAGVAAGQDAGRTRRGFTGHEQLDRTGLVHMGGRLYDPRIGRFPSPDPVVSEPWSGQAWNGYGYVGNSPVSYTDPTGLFGAGPGCNVGGVMCLDADGAGGGFANGTATLPQWHVTSPRVTTFLVWRRFSFGGALRAGSRGDRPGGWGLGRGPEFYVGVGIEPPRAERVARNFHYQEQTAADAPILTGRSARSARWPSVGPGW